MVRDLRGIQSHLAYFVQRAPIVCLVDRVGEEELGLPLESVYLERHSDGGTNQNTLRRFLGDYLGSFLYPEDPPEFCRDHKSASLANSAGF